MDLRLPELLSAPVTATILVVDDEPHSLSLLRDLLNAEGYAVIEAQDGHAAIDQAFARTPDLILLDLMLPGIDGLGVCRVLRADARTAEVPIIMVTAFDDRKIRLAAIEEGADDFLTKPVDRVELRARVRSITRINRYRRLHDERRRAAAELADAYDSTLAGWARALDLRDRETEGHSRRVTDLTVATARRLGLGEPEIIHLRRGALLHDIGKLGVPDAILHKTGPLTEQEWEIMRRHPSYARDMLEPISYLRPALDIPYCHHERWDGRGYPRGLAGHAIPLAARIFAMVDVWDAMTNDRVYRPALPPAEAARYIYTQAGQHFDPDLTGMFLQVVGAAE